MKREITQITNFATFTSREGDDSLVKVIRNDAGEEVGFELSGTLTTFDLRNENGGVFRSGSYDKFVDDYFVKHSLNVPLCLLHDDTDIRNLCGVVKSMTKTDNGVEITWMHDDALGYDDNGIEGFLKGAMHVIDSSLEPQDVDGNTLTFEYTSPDTPEQ